MKKVRIRIVTVIVMIVTAMSALPVIPTALGASETDTLTPVAVQQRRMWCTQDYNSGDYTYSPWRALSWGRAFYLRFMTDGAKSGNIAKATVTVQALARASEKEVYLAALSLSDSASLRVETDVTSEKPTLRVTGTKATATANDSKLLTNTNGYYQNDVYNSVVAYTKATASDEKSSESATSGDIEYSYPVTIRLDVTEAVRNAVSTGNHVQFALLSPKQVYADGQNIADMADFADYKNGKIYNRQGEVIGQADTASLDHSGPVCGTASYYTPDTKTTDDYFSWMYILSESQIKLELEYQTDEEFFADTAALAKEWNGPEDYQNYFSELRRLHTDEVLQKYDALKDRSSVLQKAYEYLTTSAPSLSGYQKLFSDAVDDALMGRWDAKVDCTFSVVGIVGTIRLWTRTGKTEPTVYIKGYKDGSEVYRTALSVTNGVGNFNLAEEIAVFGIDKIEIYAGSDGDTAVSETVAVVPEEPKLPEIFITEVTNNPTVMYEPDKGAQNSGNKDDLWEFIELYNYSDHAVDLNDCQLVHTYNKKDYALSLVTENGGSTLLQPGEVYVIGIYNKYSADYGYAYETEAEKNAYWDAFNEFYSTDIPLRNRAIAPFVQSRNSQKSLNGAYELNSNGTDNSVSFRSKDGKELLAFADMSTGGEESVDSISFQYGMDPYTKTSEFLFCTGCFPGRILREQEPNYTEPTVSDRAGAFKVISYNILAVDQLGHTVKNRQPLLLNVLAEYEPDVLGLQEVNATWVKFLNENMPAEYSRVEGLSTNGHSYQNASGTWDLLNPIYYRNDKYKKLADGAFFLTESGQIGKSWDSVNMNRTATWVVLEDNITGQRVCHINTHLVLSGKTGRTNSCIKLYSFGAQMREKYGCGIVITGDHNMREGSEPYQIYEKSGIVTDSKYYAKQHDNGSTCDNFETNSVTYAVPIDFCFVSPDEFTCEEYRVLDGVYGNERLSDHRGLYTRLYFKSTDEKAPEIFGVKDGGRYCEEVTFIITDDSYFNATLGGVPIEVGAAGYRIRQAGEYALSAVDMAGNRTDVSFTVGEHRYGDWKIERQATCAAIGKRSRTCVYCKAMQTENIAPTGKHTAGAWTVTKQPTATATGVSVQKCTVCGKELARKTLAKTGDPCEMFTDIDRKAWYHKSIDYAVSNGLFEGMTKTTFAPEAQMTRSMFVAVLGRLAGVSVNKNTATKFKDVPTGTWYTGYVAWAAKEGIVGGTSPDTFAPNDNVTREQICKMMAEYCNYAGITLQNKNKAVTFKDADQISGWAKKYVSACQKAGLVNGSDGKFNPKANASRAEVAQILMNFSNNYLK